MNDSRHDQIVEAAARYKALAGENYDRVCRLARALREGFCAYLAAAEPPCVLLVPPEGPFEPEDAGPRAFSIPPEGFQPLGPISFGLAVRIDSQGNWLRLALTCEKVGASFTVRVAGGGAHPVAMPLIENDFAELYDHLFARVLDWFRLAIDDYENGEYGGRAMGFDFSRETDRAIADD